MGFKGLIRSEGHAQRVREDYTSIITDEEKWQNADTYGVEITITITRTHVI